MNPVTHLLSSWAVASALPASSRRERALITLGGVVPDVDGLGAVPDVITRLLTESPTAYFHLYHHKLHCVAWAACAGIAGFALAGSVTARRRFAVAALVLATFHLHLLCDVVGARGPDGDQWPIPYLLPLSDAWQWTWSGQWALNAWPNYVITFALLAFAGVVAVRARRSPVELVSARADAQVVATLRARFVPDRKEGS